MSNTTRVFKKINIRYVEQPINKTTNKHDGKHNQDKHMKDNKNNINMQQQEGYIKMPYKQRRRAKKKDK